MNKEELKNKLKEIAEKGKDFSIKAALEIKNKAKKFASDVKENRQKTKAKKAKQEASKPIHIYDEKDKELKTRSTTFTIKPMSAGGKKVSAKKSLVSLFKGPVAIHKFYFTSFTKNVLFFASAFICGWLLGLSYDIEAKFYCAFLALFLMGITIRYIKTFFGSLTYGLFAGFFTNIFVFNWIFDTVLCGTGNYLLATGALLGLALILALPMIIFSLLAWRYKNKLLVYPLASACAWVALELIVQLISYKGFGFPWFVLGYTQYANLELIQISSILGAYGVSFFIVFCSFSASLVLGKNVNLKVRFINFVFIAAIWFLFTSYGQVKLAAYQGEGKTLKAAIVQPNTHKAMVEGNIAQVSNMLNEIAVSLQNYTGLDLIIWPESTLPGYLEKGSLKDFMAQVSTSTHAAQIAGGSAVSEQPKNKDTKKKHEQLEQQEFVAAGLYEKGSLSAEHHKRKLVPFGEFLPFQKQLKEFYEKNAISSLTGSFVEGSGPAQVLVLPGKQKTSFGTQICFESIFPILWRLEVLGGAEFFVNLSNDGWFLNTAAPYQHLRANVFRAVENNRPILRSANSGISAYINAFGKVEYQAGLNEQDLKIVDLTLPLNPGQTFYTLYGDIFGFLCIFLTLVFAYSCLDSLQEND